jgi:hypothetical protein
VGDIESRSGCQCETSIEIQGKSGGKINSQKKKTLDTRPRDLEGFEPPASTSQSEDWFRVSLVVLGDPQTLDFEPK